MNHLANKGPVNVVYDICKFLDRKRFNPIIVTLVPESKTISIEKKFLDLNIEIRKLNSSYLKIELGTFFVAKQVAALIRDLDNCIVHAHCYHPTIVASWLREYKTVATLHNISIDDFTMKHGKVMGSLLSMRFRNSLKNIGCSVALTDAMLEYYKGCSKNLIRIFNGVDYANNYSLEEKNALYEKLNLDTSKKIVVVSGSMILRKNTDFLISELKKSKRNDFVCVLLGTGVRFDYCKSLAEGDERFRFEGMVNNVKEYLALADYSISASKSEGLPLGVLESLCMGVPSLLSDIRPHHEIAETLSFCGVKLFDLSEGALLNTFEEILEKSYDKQAIEVSTKSVYGADVMAINYEQVYCEKV